MVQSGRATYRYIDMIRNLLWQLQTLFGQEIQYCKLICKNVHVSISVHTTRAISGISGTMAITQPEALQILKKLGFRVIHQCRFQI